MEAHKEQILQWLNQEEGKALLEEIRLRLQTWEATLDNLQATALDLARFQGAQLECRWLLALPALLEDAILQEKAAAALEAEEPEQESLTDEVFPPTPPEP